MKPVADPVLPGLSVALDAERVVALLGEALPECRDELELVGGRIHDVQYKPGRKALLLYGLKFRNRTTGRSARQFVSLQALAEDERPPELPDQLEARYLRLPDRVMRTPAVHLSEPGIVAYAFPVDPGLPRLIDAFDPGSMRDRLSRMWSGRGVRARRVTARYLGYTPQARAAILYDVLAESRDSGLPEVRRLVGKSDAHKDAARVFAGAWALWRAGGRRVNLAPPVGFISDLNLTLQERVDGDRLSDLAGKAAFLKPVRKTALAASVIHELSVPMATRRSPGKEARVVHRWGDVIAAIRPDQRARVERLRDRLAAEIERRASMIGSVHGDLHPSNVLVDDGRVTLIDVDNMAYGDPLHDVGRFLSALRTSSLRVFGSPFGLAGAGDAFLEQYLARTGEDESRVRLFEAASLMLSAAAGFRLQRPAWQDSAESLLDEAELAFERAQKGRPLGPGPGARPAAVRLANGLDWASDSVYMSAALDPHLRRVYGAGATACRVRSDVATKRCRRLHYRVKGTAEGRKWTGALEGTVWPRGGRRRFARLVATAEALGRSPPVPVLPRPIAYLAPIGMVVVEPPQGKPLSSLIGSAQGAAAARRIARALAALHACEPGLDKTQSPEQQVSALRERLEPLKDADFDFHARACRLLEMAAGGIFAAAARSAPVLRTLSPERVLCAGQRIAFTELDDVVLAHPFVDLAGFLARLELLVTRDHARAAVEALGDALRASYLAEAGVSGEALPAFEALALLDLACARRQGSDGEATAERLLHRTDLRLRVPAHHGTGEPAP